MTDKHVPSDVEIRGSSGAAAVSRLSISSSSSNGDGNVEEEASAAAAVSDSMAGTDASTASPKDEKTIDHTKRDGPATATSCAAEAAEAKKHADKIIDLIVKGKNFPAACSYWNEAGRGALIMRHGQHAEIYRLAKREDVLGQFAGLREPSVSPTVRNPESSNSTAEPTETEDENRIRKLYRDTLRFVVSSEETQRSVGCYCKDYDKESNEWAENHFSMNDKKKDGFGVVLTSYEYGSVSKALGWQRGIDTKPPPSPASSGNSEINGGDSTPTHWLKIPCPQDSSEKPEVPDDTNNEIRQYLEFIKTENRERFQGCNLNDMIPLLTIEDAEAVPIPKKPGDGYDKIRSFINSALEYSNSESSQLLKQVYGNLFQWQNHSEGGTAELVAGFGHVRMVYTSNSKQDQPRILNGPLFEVPLEAELRPGANGSAEILIFPAKDAQATLNDEVMSAIIAGGGGNKYYIDKLNSLVDNTEVASLRLDNTDSFQEILRTVPMLLCGGRERSANDPEVHVPPRDLETLVVTDAWCLRTRKVVSTVYSKDARKLIKALDEKKLEITEPVRTLVSGPKSFKKYADRRSSASVRKGEDLLVYPLPASQGQRDAGLRLLVDHEPVCIMEGPPGTGKTHSIVNVSTAALSEGKTVMMTSSNPRALRAYLEKLPQNSRALAVDMSCCKEGGMLEFMQGLERVIQHIQEPETGDRDSRLKDNLARTREAYRLLEQKVQAENEDRRRLLAEDALKDAFEVALELSMKAQWLVKAVFTTELDLKRTAALLEKIQNDKEPVSFGNKDDIIVFDDEFLKLVQEKADEVPTSTNVSSNFKLRSDMTQGDKKLSLVRVGGRMPKSQSDWESVLAAIKFRNDCLAAFIKCGCGEENIFNGDRSSYQAEFLALLKEGLELKSMIDPLSVELKRTLRAVFEDVQHKRKMQNKCRKLLSEIHKLEAELVYVKVVAALKKKLDDSAMSTLTQLCLSINNMNAGALASSNTKSERSNRHFDGFIEIIKKTVKFMPFVVMTTDQISSCLPPDHSFDVGIIDEASQSNCTAITIMARCKQLLVVGDAKQVSPSQVALSEERIRGLKARQPDIDTAHLLLPEYSFFDLFRASFPRSSVVLSDHYRCDPRIIAISNKCFYNSRLVPLRLPSGVKAVEDLPVKGTRDKSKKTNQEEAETIAGRVRDEIRRTAEDDDFETIGAISLGGSDQVKLIESLIEENIDPLREEFGDDVIARHKILVGTPQKFQGDERDIVFLSTVHSPNKPGQKFPVETGDTWKSWNVALTRAKNRMVLCRSYDIGNLKTSDYRQQVLRVFSKPREAKAEPKSMALESDYPLAKAVKDAISGDLRRRGYRAEKQGGAIWSDALCVHSPPADDGIPNNNCALVCIENAGESEEEWAVMADQQRSLERAGRACLRVDCISLALNFDATFHDVLDFLEESGLPVPSKRKPDDGTAAAPPTAKRPREE